MFGNDANSETMPIKNIYFICFIGSNCADVKVQTKAREYRPKIQNFNHFSIFSFSPHTDSRPGAERIGQSEGRWSRPSKTALERSNLTEK